MNAKLYFGLERADELLAEASNLRDALLKLSNNEIATEVLISAFAQATLDSESLWATIEQTPEFKSQYSTREQARMDFLKFKSSVPKDD